MRTKSTESSLLALAGGMGLFFPKNCLGRAPGQNLDSWKGGGGLPNLETPATFRVGGGLEKRG